MKGVIFTEFLEMVEGEFGFEIADKIVQEAELASGGVYTALGTYDHQEMVSMVVNLSQATEISVPKLLHAFGEHAFGQFSKSYGVFFEKATGTIDFLSRLENYIHVEVLKLYPDAELPRFEIHQPNPGILQMIYHSDRGLADFAEGLIAGCIKHFKEDVQLTREDLHENKTHTRFTLRLNPETASV
ncbi:MAG: heme NO-binding domain-containing protein [Bacteroidota bacterium]